jgi:hypothetical protein
MINLAFFFSTTVLVTTIATLVLAFVAYFAYKLREWRKPKLTGTDQMGSSQTADPIFLNRYLPDDTIPDEHGSHE